MKKIVIIMLAIGVIAILGSVAHVHAGGLRGRTVSTPRVGYIEPNNDSVVDLTGKNKLVFRWKEVPIPAGGREAYKFTLYKGTGYDLLESQDLGRSAFSVEVPADKFENGAKYSWRVKQRDSHTMEWGRYDTWYFTVKK